MSCLVLFYSAWVPAHRLVWPTFWVSLSLLSYTTVETLSEAQKCVLSDSKSNTELIITIISSKVSKVTILSYEKQTEQKYNTHTPKA